MQRMRRRGQRGVAVLDVLTGIVLLIAVILLVRPGAALHGVIRQWRTERTNRELVQAHWDKAIALAQPLYANAEDPQVLEFLDYECPFCRNVASTVDSAVAVGVRVAVVHLPLEIHALAKPAARAAVCASRTEDFLRLHRILLYGTGWKEQATATGRITVSDSGIDARIAHCIRSGKADSLLSRHIALAKVLRINGTPRFVSRWGSLAAPPTVSSLWELAAKK